MFQATGFRRAIGLLAICLPLSCSERQASSTENDKEQGTPQRVVVMAPAAAEMLEALELEDRVVGIGEFGPWPAALAELPSVGRYDAPNVETVLSLGADALLTAASEAGASTHRRLHALGVEVVALDTSTYDGVFRSLARVGELFGEETRAAEVASRLRAELGEIRGRAAGAPVRSVLFVVGRDPLYVAGPGSHIDEMIRLVGGRNVAEDALTPYQQVSVEAILERMPEVIVDTSNNAPDAARGQTAGSWGRWQFLPAVRESRVYWIDPGRLVIPGLRLPEMTLLMGKLVHPERFGEPTPAELK